MGDRKVTLTKMNDSIFFDCQSFPQHLHEVKTFMSTTFQGSPQIALKKRKLTICPYLLQLKNMFVEVKLKLFIGKIDTELFKTVMQIIFKSKNIQHSYGASLKLNNAVVITYSIYSGNILNIALRTTDSSRRTSTTVISVHLPTWQITHIHQFVQ